MNTVKISQKRYSAAGINFLQPLSAYAQQARKMNIAVLDVSILLFPAYRNFRCNGQNLPIKKGQ